MGREGRVYCCALVLICGTVGTEVGAEYTEVGPGLVTGPGWRAPGMPPEGCVLLYCVT